LLFFNFVQDSRHGYSSSDYKHGPQPPPPPPPSSSSSSSAFRYSNGDSSYHNQHHADNGNRSNGHGQHGIESNGGSRSSKTEASSYTSQTSEWEKPTQRNEHIEKELFHATPTGINFDSYDDIPVDVNGRDIPKEVQSFNECSFHETILSNIQMSKYDKPTPVQKYSIPIVLARRDMMACAQTGSGKTAAFLLPILSLIYKEGATENYAHTRRGKKWMPIALILAPTRELAIQIYDEAKKVCFSCISHRIRILTQNINKINMDDYGHIHPRDKIILVKNEKNENQKKNMCLW
jgi:ATP-dependent RNA helicase DDX3X